MTSTTSAPENERLESLLSYQILDTPAEASFDLVTLLVSEMFAVPHSCVSFVDKDRVWFKSSVGLDTKEVDRELGFCSSLVESNEKIRHIEDATTHPETKLNSLTGGDGGIRFYAGAPLIAPSGHRIGTLCAFGPKPRGLTEVEQNTFQKLAGLVMHEIELRKTQRQLERTETALRQSERLESVGMVASGVAHDVNNLLGGILGNAELLKLEIKGQERAEQLVERIETTGQRAADLVGDVLEYAGKENQVPAKAVELNTLVSETQALLASTTSTNVSFKLDLQPNLPCVSGRPTGLRQVAMNLLTNASEICGERGGNVVITTRYEPSTSRVVLSIRDDGPGMTDEVKERLFEPFFSSRAGGRGLGLSICSRIVEQHGGTISVESELGIGTVFHVALPADVSANVVSVTATSETAPSATTLAQVLVVDDEPAIAEVIEGLLRSLGYEVLVAGGGAEAISLLQSHQHSICSIVLDWSMPIVDGRRVLEMMKAEQIDIPVVLTSGHSEETALKGVGDYSISAFVKKPFRLAELAALIQRFSTSTA